MLLHLWGRCGTSWCDWRKEIAYFPVTWFLLTFCGLGQKPWEQTLPRRRADEPRLQCCQVMGFTCRQHILLRFQDIFSLGLLHTFLSSPVIPLALPTKGTAAYPFRIREHIEHSRQIESHTCTAMVVVSSINTGAHSPVIPIPRDTEIYGCSSPSM